jgi:hypothetical protein
VVSPNLILTTVNQQETSMLWTRTLITGFTTAALLSTFSPHTTAASTPPNVAAAIASSVISTTTCPPDDLTLAMRAILDGEPYCGHTHGIFLNPNADGTYTATCYNTTDATPLAVGSFVFIVESSWQMSIPEVSAAALGLDSLTFKSVSGRDQKTGIVLHTLFTEMSSQAGGLKASVVMTPLRQEADSISAMTNAEGFAAATNRVNGGISDFYIPSPDAPDASCGAIQDCALKCACLYNKKLREAQENFDLAINQCAREYAVWSMGVCNVAWIGGPWAYLGCQGGALIRFGLCNLNAYEAFELSAARARIDYVDCMRDECDITIAGW